MGKLSQLSTLRINNCTFEEVNSLAPIPCDRLSALTISGCDLTDELLSTLEIGEAKLYEIDLSNNRLANPDKLAEITKTEKLTELDLSGNQISDLSALKDFQKLVTLSVSDNQITSLKALEGCIYLETINARNNSIDLLDGLKNTTLLKSVDLSGNSISDISVLSPSAGTITKLYLGSNALEDISVLQDMSGLVYLDISDNRIKDITPVCDKRNLIGLDASSNLLEEVTSFVTTYVDSGYQLEYLDLSHNRILKFETDSHLPLLALNLEGNPLSESVSLTLKEKIDYLNLAGCTPPDLSFLYSGEGIDHLIVNFSEDLDLSKLIVHDKVVFINCPLDRQVAVNEAVNGKAEFISASEYTNRDDLDPLSFCGKYETKELILRTKNLAE